MSRSRSVVGRLGFCEAPCCTNSGGILPLSDFGTGLLGEDSTAVSGSNFATDSSIAQCPDRKLRGKMTPISSKSQRWVAARVRKHRRARRFRAGERNQLFVHLGAIAAPTYRAILNLHARPRLKAGHAKIKFESRIRLQ